MRNIKKFLNVQRLIHSLCITLFLAYMPFAQEMISDALWLGFPYKFYTIYTLHDFAIHFGIGTFLSDVFIIYLIYTLILIIAKKIRKAIRQGCILMKKQNHMSLKN